MLAFLAMRLPLLSGLLLAALLSPAARAAKDLQVYFVDVEGGQATLIVAPSGESMLIDTGWPGHNHRDADRIIDTVTSQPASPTHPQGSKPQEPQPQSESGKGPGSSRLVPPAAEPGGPESPRPTTKTRTSVRCGSLS